MSCKKCRVRDNVSLGYHILKVNVLARVSSPGCLVRSSSGNLGKLMATRLPIQIIRELTRLLH